jgi:hypothetical protein
MLREAAMVRRAVRPLVAGVGMLTLLASGMNPARGEVTREEVERAIHDAVQFLKRAQRDDGSWPDYDATESHTGVTSLVTLALLTAGERPDSKEVSKALAYLRQFGPEDLNNTYTVALQTMVFAAADPDRHQVPISNNAAWLEKAQIKADDRFDWPGSWTYSAAKSFQGDGSNSQYALLGLHAAAEAGIKIPNEVWTLARQFWEDSQRRDGSWPYRPNDHGTSASMTCAGISSLVITGMKRSQSQEFLVNGTIKNCGVSVENEKLAKAINWMANHFHVGQNFGHDQTWKYYYLYGLERAGRLSGLRYFGTHDWYRRGAEELVHNQDPVLRCWEGINVEQNRLIATSFALLFLAKGRAPVVVNKLRHGPDNDWNNDPDDIRNLVNVVSHDWKHLLTWQMVDPERATVEDMLQAPIVFFNGHQTPEFGPVARRNLRDYVEQGGFLFAEACCSEPEFDRGFRALMKDLFPEREYELHPLPSDHAVWRSKHLLSPEVHPLWGIEHGCRTVVIYSPQDLSCFWNQMETQPGNPVVVKATRVGENVIDYATGRELPADKLTAREITHFGRENPRRGALQIAKLRHAGDWNVAPLAIPNLTTMLRDKLSFDVVINHREILPRDPNLIHYPLLYIHGRAALSFAPEDMAALRRHLEPGGGTIFADAACGSAAFDAAFRRFVNELLPNNPLVSIPHDDDLYSKRIGGYDLSDVQYSKAAGGGRDYPQLEGVKINGHWAVIYSKYDIGCALERHQGADCKGYTHESALRIAANIVLYSSLP